VKEVYFPAQIPNLLGMRGLFKASLTPGAGNDLGKDFGYDLMPRSQFF
jgi:hypothetical protein